MDTGAGADSDRIELRGLRLSGIVGVLAEERTRAQPLEFDLDLYVDMRAAARSDDLTDTIDYGAVCGLVESRVADLRPLLLERLAAEVADAVLGLDGRISAARVAVRKMRPPVPQMLHSSGVVVTRRRDR